MDFNPVIPISTIWGIEHVRAGKVLSSWQQRNVLTDQGLNHMLNVVFHGNTQISPWYIIVFANDRDPISSDTYKTPGYAEFTGYSELTRVPFVELPASNKTMSNIANRSKFTITSEATIYGTALVGGGVRPASKGDKDNFVPADSVGFGGTLFCSSKFETGQLVKADDILMVSCTIILEDV